SASTWPSKTRLPFIRVPACSKWLAPLSEDRLWGLDSRSKRLLPKHFSRAFRGEAIKTGRTAGIEYRSTLTSGANYGGRQSHQPGDPGLRHSDPDWAHCAVFQQARHQ